MVAGIEIGDSLHSSAYENTAGDDEADQLAVGRLDGFDDVSPEVASMIALGGTAAAFDPAVVVAWISFETGFITKENSCGRVG
jgi:hypothetical protein